MFNKADIKNVETTKTDSELKQEIELEQVKK